MVLATSDLHLQQKLRMTREQALEAISTNVRYARERCAEVEFSAEDASRTGIDFLCEAVGRAVKAGATIVNLPDTVGYSVPEEYAAMFRSVIEYLGGAHGIILSAHCHDDLGLAVANSVAAVRAGARTTRTGSPEKHRSDHHGDRSKGLQGTDVHEEGP